MGSSREDSGSYDVGFIGLGDQGTPIVRHIAGAGHTLHLWARRSESIEPFADIAASVAANPKELGERCSIVGVCVIDASGVREVCLGDDGLLAGMAPGTVVVIHSTVPPDACTEIAECARERNVRVLDAPVSRRNYDNTKFTLLVGGDDDTLRYVSPVFQAYAEHVVHLGPLGSGQLAKTLNNILLLANMELAHEAFQTAEVWGLDREALSRAFRLTSARSFALDVLASDPQGRADFPRLMAKEYSIFGQQLDSIRTSEPELLSATAERLLRAMQANPYDWAPSWYEPPN